MARAYREAGLGVDRFKVELDAIQHLPGFSPVAVSYDDAWNVVGTHRPKDGGSGKSLIINGHIDVVPTGPADFWAKPPFAPHIEGDWLYGRGAGDMKAGLVAGLFALKALQRLGLQPAADLYLLSVIEEECTGNGALACLARGYRGWEWTVTVARVPRGRTATVCEAELLPGDDAILGKAWVPWSDRLRPGDIGAGDVLPFRADDPRLVPGWTPTGDPELDEVAIDELALARVRVLSPLGRDEAADRWYRGAHGPTPAGALASSAACASCGFLVPLQGSLGQLFGVCANEWSPDDGKVVSLDHGCGAHSETDVPQHASDWPAPDPLIDELRIEVERAPEAPASEATPDEAPSSEETTPAP
jgi:hypothetical protein